MGNVPSTVWPYFVPIIDRKMKSRDRVAGNRVACPAFRTDRAPGIGCLAAELQPRHLTRELQLLKLQLKEQTDARHAAESKLALSELRRKKHMVG